uniref:Nanos-type domain-containing protein n=1 Tax=Ailuropoda melanoleuca TaxID=9646 RepID=A0A7N5K379_AILME
MRLLLVRGPSLQVAPVAWGYHYNRCQFLKDQLPGAAIQLSQHARASQKCLRTTVMKPRLKPRRGNVILMPDSSSRDRRRLHLGEDKTLKRFIKSSPELAACLQPRVRISGRLLPHRLSGVFSNLVLNLATAGPASSPAGRREPQRQWLLPWTPPPSNSCLNYLVKNGDTGIPTISRHLSGEPTPRNMDFFPFKYISPATMQSSTLQIQSFGNKGRNVCPDKIKCTTLALQERKSIECIPAAIVNGNPHEARSTARIPKLTAQRHSSQTTIIQMHSDFERILSALPGLGEGLRVQAPAVNRQPLPFKTKRGMFCHFKGQGQVSSESSLAPVAGASAMASGSPIPPETVLSVLSATGSQTWLITALPRPSLIPEVGMLAARDAPGTDTTANALIIMASPSCRCACSAGTTRRRVALYTTHILKGPDGRVLCPVLRRYTCPLCGARGDNAHTIKYCPLSKVPPPPNARPTPRSARDCQPGKKLR